MSAEFLGIAFAWLVSSVLAFGMFYADMQGQFKWAAWPERHYDAALAIFLSLFGPLSMLIAFLVTGFARHGLRYRSISAEESWQDHRKKFPHLSREEWLG